MKKMHYTEVTEEIPPEEGVKDTTIRWLISDKDGAENFAMRIFVIQPGGHTPHHQHDWEHELFLIKGNLVLRSGDNKIPFKPGDRVRVKEGYFENFEGDVEAVDEANGRITVMINIFGRSTPVELEHWQVESV